MRPAIDRKCKIWIDKRAKCLVFSVCGVENGNDREMRDVVGFIGKQIQQILKPEGNQAGCQHSGWEGIRHTPLKLFSIFINHQSDLIQRNDVAAWKSQPKAFEVSFPGNIHWALLLSPAVQARQYGKLQGPVLKCAVPKCLVIHTYVLCCTLKHRIWHNTITEDKFHTTSFGYRWLHP